MERMLEKLERLMAEKQGRYEEGALMPEIEYLKAVEVKKKFKKKIKPKDNLLKAVEKMIQNGLNEIINAYDYLLTHLEDPEGVHQIRVRIRKLRAVLDFFTPIFQEVKYLEQQEKFREMGQQFGVVRQLDVLLEEIKIIENTGIISIGDFRFLKNKINKKREDAFRDITDNLTNDQFALDVLDIWVWLLNQPWEKDVSILKLSVKKYSDMRLGIWLKKIDKSMKNLNMEHQEEIHKVRIKSKKMRYVIEQLSPILNKDTQKSINKFEKLQDDLGYFHDVYANKILLEQLITESDENQLHYEAGMVVGWQTLQGNMKMKKYLK